MGKLFDLGYLIASIPKLLQYAWVSLSVMAVTLFTGLVIGVVVALMRTNRVKVANGLCRVYISYTRGTPILVQLFLCFFALPAILSQFGVSTRNIPVFLYAYIVFSLHLGAYAAETLRGALGSLGTEQLEAALSVGMGKLSCYGRILLPQAFALSLPDLSNLTIVAFKETSLLFNIGMVDMMTRAKLLSGQSQRHLELYIAVGLIYIAICLVINLVFRQLEGSMRRRKYGQ